MRCLLSSSFLASFSLFCATPTEQTFDTAQVEYYQNDNKTNQIPYFDNRFRIDGELEEITLIFYRKSGSVPIILVRPDGSKIRVNNIDHDTVQWYDDRTFDMIKIKKPMPGPWQAIGDILPNSQILVVSDVVIKVKPLPEIVFSGETLKVEGQLFNGDKTIDSPSFREVVKLDVNFYSTNNASYENFGADAIKVTSFRDDGRGLDEYANDSTFTGEFVLNFAPGEWQPVYLVKLPMATRELRQTPIMLHKTPVEISVKQSDNEETPHQLNLTIDSTFVDPDSLVFQGKVTFPDRQVEPFSIMDEKGNTREKDFTYTEPGIYRINMSAFGKTIAGREFRLVVPEFTFHVKPTAEQAEAMLLSESDLTDTGADMSQEAITDMAVEEPLVVEQKPELNEQSRLLIIAGGNAIIIALAFAVFIFIKRKGKSKKIKK
ncbi:TIGR03503 family protein [Litorilituus sediminis]|uniref:TIGR03503 family protein n=2 Tax=Litorilituus sediminis TaxID=718192 RepID=A0A4P6PBG8_9GAMM|nr:TIGR03503 family protein [Litorilituus sediminis]